MTAQRPWLGERPEPSFDEEIKPRRLKDEFVDFSVVWRNRFRILAVSGISAVLGATVAAQLPPTYEAASMVMVASRSAHVIDIANVVPDAETATEAVVHSEAAVLESTEMLKSVAERLNLANDPEFNSDLREPGLLRSLLDGVRSVIGGLLGSSVEDDVGPDDAVIEATDELSDHLSVRPVGTSHVIEVTASSESPARAADIANMVVKRYVENQVQAKLEASERAQFWLEDRVEKLRNELIAAEQKVEDAKPRASTVELRELQREAEASRAVYEQFLIRLKETRERGGFQDADARIVSLAEVPSSPEGPKRLLIVLIATVSGGMAAVVVTLVAEARRYTLFSEEDIRRCCGLPVITNLPEVEGATTPLEVLEWMSKRPFSTLSEAVRWLRVKLDNSIERSPQVIVVTSALPREGKSTLALMLAENSASNGMKTLLVDADLRRKFLSNMFKPVDGSAHIVEVRGFKVFRLHEVIGGDHRLLSSTVFREILSEARGRYETIIVDAPPALSVSDIAVLCRNADATIVACRWNTTPRGALEQAVRQLRALGANVTGVALTLVNLERQAETTFAGADYAYREGLAYYSEEALAGESGPIRTKSPVRKWRKAISSSPLPWLQRGLAQTRRWTSRAVTEIRKYAGRSGS